MFPPTVELAWRAFQQHHDPRALAIVFDRTSKDLLALGRHLASPGTDAEDLVQATFVTAIEDAATHRHGERVLPWLTGILANHARAARRRSRRPLDPTRLTEPVGDARDDVAAAEMHAELRAAIDRLPEAYRPVLRLVFEHGLQSHEIARTLERPAGTVRAQVTRGLDLLRRHLPASLAGSAAVAVATGRGLAAVRTAVLGRVGGTGTGLTAVLSLGGLLVLQHKFAIAIAAVALVALALLWSPPDARPLGDTTDVVAATNPATAPLAGGPPPVDTTATPEREPDAEAVPPVAEGPAPQPTPTGNLRVRVFGPDGQPCAGIGIAVFPVAELQNLGRSTRFVPTAPGGRVLFSNLAPGEWAIDLDRAGVGQTATVKIGQTIEQRLTLTAGVDVRGTVRDRSGNPVPGATVVVHGSRAGTATVATADTNGVFTVDHLTAGVELQARARGREPSLAHTVRGAAGGETTLDLVVGDTAHTVTGRVLDPAGAPVEGATVAVMPAAAAVFDPAAMDRPQVRASWLRTDANGAFQCDEASAAPQLVFATATARGLAPTWIEVDATRGQVFAELRLPRGATVTGTVTNGGQPAAGLQVVAWQGDGMRIGYLANLFGMRFVATGPDGTYRLDGLLPGPTVLRLLQAASMLRQENLTLRDGDTTTWDTDFGKTSGLAITVRGADLPANTRLTAIVTKSKLVDGEMPSIVPIQADGRGTHAPARNEPVDVVLCCMPGGRSIVQLATVRNVPPRQSTVAFELAPAQLPTRSIRGRLVDAQKAPVAGETIAATKASADGLFVRLEATSDGNGGFVLGPLPAGDYTLFAGTLQNPTPIGTAVLTIARDEQLGDLQTRPR